MRASLALGLICSASALGCGGRTSAGEHEDSAVHGEGEDGDDCATDNDCEQGLHCLYWNPGCELRGVCGAVTWAWDGSVVCTGACDCDGRWRGGGLTNFPFQFRDFNQPHEGRRCEPPDAGVQSDWDPFEPYLGYCRDLYAPDAAGSPNG